MMSIRSKFLLIFPCLLLVFSLGCSKHDEEAKESTELRAFRLIDSGRTEEAIQLLLPEVNQDPENVDLRMALASAYAHRAEIKVQKLVPLISSAKSFATEVEALKAIQERPDAPPDQSNIFGEVSDAVELWGKYMSTLGSALGFFSSLPSAAGVSALDIREAIYHASYVKPMLPENAVYVAILQIIYLKHTIIDRLIRPSSNHNATAVKNCKLNFDAIGDGAEAVGNQILDLTLTLKDAFPDEGDRYGSLHEQFASVFSDLTYSLNSLSLADELSLTVLKDRFISLGAGKLLELISKMPFDLSG